MNEILLMNRIAIVGLSDDSSRAAWGVATYLKSVGKQIIPVNPKFTDLMGETCYPNVASIPGSVELVNVFRRSDACPDVVRDAIAAHAKAVWLQSGIVSRDARRLADEAGLGYIENKCLMVEVMRLAR